MSLLAFPALYLVLASFALSPAVGASTPLVRTYEGDTFFDRWSYYGNYDNTTNGDAVFVNKSVADSSKLTYLSSANTAIIKVDNTSTVPYNEKRNTVKITSTDSYPVGSIWVLDVLRIPYGCSVWSAFWSYGKGATWPEQGEIDTIEGVNMGWANQMALHTEDGCAITASSSAYSGTVNSTSCYYEDNDNSGCAITDSSYSSYGEQFAANGGGVYVTQLAEEGVSIWFFERSSIPDAVSSANSSIDTSSLGTPSGFWSKDGCDVDKFFGDQSLVFDITLCGDWAGQSSILSTTGCSALTGTETCYSKYVLDSSNYANAYFEINSLKVYSNGSSSSSSSSSSNSTSGALSSVHSPGGSLAMSIMGYTTAGVLGLSTFFGLGLGMLV
ncbi:endo-1,3(4)-beta-glucanase [Kwoniella heveanensis CBS 569]|nr:endo-1,3(4)-beta-glucanase [Kwoniella heveanensis CBS 569]